MNLNRIPRVLFFHTGMVPTDEQREAAARFAPNVGMRNADMVSSVAFSPLEECDAVAGDVPPRYAAVYPNADSLNVEGRLLRMSDLDRAHGPVTHIDNEAARAAKPPALGQDRVTAQGATRPVGAITSPIGGFVAPVPGNPDNLLYAGSERAENGTEGTNTEGKVSRLNPQGLSDAGASLPQTGTEAGASAGPVADGGGQDGFRAPEPPKADEGEEGEEAPAKRKSGKASTGDAGTAS